MIFVDTGAWFAAFVPNDPDHAAADTWLETNREPLITTDDVIMEESQSIMESDPRDTSSHLSLSAARVGTIDESTRTFSPTERYIAEVLASEGKDVKALPESLMPYERSADALVAGRLTEFKALVPGAGSGTVRNTVNQSIKGGGQAHDIIIDARSSGLTPMEAERGLRRIAGIARGRLHSVRIIGDGYNLSRLYS
jgi:predicted nucleic acid-binding protein